MIKKTTLATFKDGTYKGEYDWTGGIPLSQGELITIVVGQSELQYKLVSKTTRLVDDGTDQNVETRYYFELIK